MKYNNHTRVPTVVRSSKLKYNDDKKYHDHEEKKEELMIMS